MNKNSGMLDYFSVLVIGDNPDEQILRYDSMADVDKPYVVYQYSDLNNIRVNRIKFYNEFLNETTDSKIKSSILTELERLNSMSDLEYYISLGELYAYDDDRNIISTENPNAKWITCDKGGRIFSNYLKDSNDNGVVSDKKSNIDWSLTHMRSDKVNVYNRTWELCVEKKEPNNEFDRKILGNMGRIKNYFSLFSNKDEYIKTSCSFWCYAVIINGIWVDMEFKRENDWIIGFYDLFLKPLDSDTLITIYECTR